MTKTHDYRRLHGVEILSVTKQDAGGWVGLTTVKHGEIRAKAALKTKMKLKKGWKGSLTVGSYGTAVVLAYDQYAHIETDSHWNILDPKLFSEAHYGFIYNVTNKLTGVQYIGRRMYHSGNWRTYTTSSKYVNADIEKYGKENFQFDIWYSVETRGDLVHLEIQEQHDNRVLTAKLDNGERAYYNRSIGGIKFIPPEKISDEQKAAIIEANKRRQDDD